MRDADDGRIMMKAVSASRNVSQKRSAYALQE